VSDEQRQYLAQVRQHNDQCVAAMWDWIKSGLQSNMDSIESFRRQVMLESNTVPLLTPDSSASNFVKFRSAMLLLGMLQLQEKMEQWANDGEIPWKPWGKSPWQK
jgi:hypothetical protein